MKTNFFPRQALAKILFVLQPRYPWYTPFPVWFNLDKSLTRWKRPILKFVICEFRKFPYENLTLFLHKLYQKFFLFYTLATHEILHAEFGSIWTTPLPNRKYYISKLIIWINRKFAYENLTFFLCKL